MSPSLLRTPCTGHSVCLPQPRHCLLSSKERWGITLSHAAPHSRPVIGHVTTVLSSDWLMTQAAGEGGSRKGRGRGGLLFVYLDKTPDLIIGNTRHWYLISSSEKNGRISMYFATFLLKYRRSNVSVNVHLMIWFWHFILPHFFNPPPVIRERDMFALCQQCSSSISPFVLLHFALIPVI